MATNFSREAALLIPGPAGPLEAIVTPAGSGDAAPRYVAILCHPHPLHGGTMENKVVTTLMRTYRDLDVQVVRFNFRGVGASAGSFDQGVGELADLLAVIAWVREQFTGAQLLLAGFSFGSAMAAQASYHGSAPAHLLLVAPPIERYAYDRAGAFPCATCVVQGDQDERVNAQGVYDWAAGLNSSLEIIRYPAAGHFFHSYLANVKADLTPILRTHLI